MSQHLFAHPNHNPHTCTHSVPPISPISPVHESFISEGPEESAIGAPVEQWETSIVNGHISETKGPSKSPKRRQRKGTKRPLSLNTTNAFIAVSQSLPNKARHSTIPFFQHLQSDYYTLRYKPKASFPVVCSKYFFLAILALLLGISLIYPIFIMFWKHNETPLAESTMFWAAVGVEGVEIIMIVTLGVVLLGSSCNRAISIVLFMLYSFARFLVGTAVLTLGVVSTFVVNEGTFHQPTLFYWLIPSFCIHYSLCVLSFVLSLIEIRRESITIARWKKLWSEWLQQRQQNAVVSVEGGDLQAKNEAVRNSVHSSRVLEKTAKDEAEESEQEIETLFVRVVTSETRSAASPLTPNSAAPVTRSNIVHPTPSSPSSIRPQTAPNSRKSVSFDVSPSLHQEESVRKQEDCANTIPAELDAKELVTEHFDRSPAVPQIVAVEVIPEPTQAKVDALVNSAAQPEETTSVVAFENDAESPVKAAPPQEVEEQVHIESPRDEPAAEETEILEASTQVAAMEPEEQVEQPPAVQSTSTAQSDDEPTIDHPISTPIQILINTPTKQADPVQEGTPTHGTSISAQTEILPSTPTSTTSSQTPQFYNASIAINTEQPNSPTHAEVQTPHSSHTTIATNTDRPSTPEVTTVQIETQTPPPPEIVSSPAEISATQTETVELRDASSFIAVETSHAEIQSDPVHIVIPAERAELPTEEKEIEPRTSVEIQTHNEPSQLNTSTSSQTDALPDELAQTDALPDEVEKSHDSERLVQVSSDELQFKSRPHHAEPSMADSWHSPISSAHKDDELLPLSETHVRSLDMSPIRHFPASVIRSPSPTLTPASNTSSPSDTMFSSSTSFAALGFEEQHVSPEHHLDKLQPKQRSPRNGEINIFEKKLLDLRSKLNIQNEPMFAAGNGSPQARMDPQSDRAKLRTIFNKYSPKT